MSPHARGFGLVELIVAMTILSVGVLGLAGAALLGQRSLAAADAVERGVDAAALVLDSLMHVPSPVAGTRVLTGADLGWTVIRDGRTSRIRLDVRVTDGARTHSLRFFAVHDGPRAR